jgi:mannose/fructose/N-acetylgalactosamine-specific phosphotransferase system component IIC
MAQFLLTMTLLSIAGLIASIVAGFRSTPAHASTHILIALATVIVGLFAQSMTMFFFIGMGKEVKEASGQDPEVVRRTRAHKAKVFPAATYAIAVLMVTFILGGGVKTGKTPVWLHTALAAASLVMLARAYYVELRAMEDNARLMEEYLKE